MGDLHRLDRPKGLGMIRKAAKTSIGLSLLFLVVYGTCNWITSLRSDVGSFYFEWERHIPFVPLAIIPYMSIDLFFLAAPFVCRTDRQRRTLSNRIIAAILIAGLCFLLFPLKFAFDRPSADGVLGVIFDKFREMDKPFNEFPSLHIALRTILAVLFVGVTAGLTKWTLRIWFVLIGLSTLLTYQHHVIDVVGGFALGVICIHLFQDEPLARPVVVNRRIGIYYLAVAIFFMCTAVAGGPIAWILLWPAFSMGLVAAGYFGLGAGVYRKRDGRLRATTWLLLWPVLLAQRLSLIYYARQCNPWDRLTDRVWIGRLLSDTEAQRAIEQGVTAVLDLTGEFSEAAPFRSLQYQNLAVLDLTAPSPDQFSLAVEFIQGHRENGVVYVHCKVGYSRTAGVAGAWLLAHGAAETIDDAVRKLREARPSIIIRPEIHSALQAFHARRTESPALQTR